MAKTEKEPSGGWLFSAIYIPHTKWDIVGASYEYVLQQEMH